MNTRILAFATGALLAGAGLAHAESVGVPSTLTDGPMCEKSTVGGVLYAWQKTDSSRTTVFQSAHDNNRSLIVDLASDQGASYASDYTACNEGDVQFLTPFVTH